MRLLGSVLAGFALVCMSSSCTSAPGARTAGTAEDACEPRPRSLGEGATLAGREGDFALVMAPDGSDEPGPPVRGTLTLRATAPEDRTFRRPGSAPDSSTQLPLYGWTDVSVAGLSGRVSGTVDSRDPARPGVLVIEQAAGADRPASITIRFGSLANDLGRTAVDPAFFALRVEWMDDDGSFGGRWSTGVRAPERGGIFCATPSQPGEGG